MTKPIPFSITLEDSWMLNPGVKHFRFKSTQKPAFNYLAGQFITILFEHNNNILRRSYSIANAPAEDNYIEFAASYIEHGPGSDLLFHLKPGDILNVTGPFGRLTLKDELPKRYVLVATSTGVTPYRSMLTELKKRLETHPTLQVLILQGVQKHENVLYADEFLEFVQQYPQATFRAYLSRDAKDNMLPHEFPGYVQHAFTTINLDPNNDMVYLCGNPSMIDDAFTILKDIGFTTQQIVREKYITGK